MLKNNNPFIVRQETNFKYTSLVDENENFFDEISVREAKKMATEVNKDLVCFNPPSKDEKAFCKIIDYGKWKYKQEKKRKKSKQNKKQAVKEIRFSPSISDHDVEHKLRQVRSFLKKGDKVILSMRFRGAQRRHSGVGEQRMNEIVGMCQEDGEEEKRSRTDNQIIVRLTKKPQNGD